MHQPSYLILLSFLRKTNCSYTAFRTLPKALTKRFRELSPAADARDRDPVPRRDGFDDTARLRAGLFKPSFACRGDAKENRSDNKNDVVLHMVEELYRC